MSQPNLPAEWQTPEVEEFDGGGNVVQKADLIGKPFLIGKVTFRKGDYGPFVSLTAVNTANEEFILNDGSTGIFKQVVTRLHERGMLDPGIDKPDSQEYDVRWLSRKGLRRSDYETPDGKPASTYYLT